MAKKVSKKVKGFFSKNKLQESYATIILGAIIVIVIGLLVANFISKNNRENIEEGLQADLESQKSQETEYSVKSGDSLSKIAQETYGNRDYWRELARINSISNPNLIYKDTKLKLPSKEEVEKVKEDMTITSYKVESGDTLFKISEKVYGNGNNWKVIARANKVTYLSNGNPLIVTDSTISIPR